MTANTGPVVAGPFRPLDSADTSATHDEQYGIGGYRTVASTAARDAITTERRKAGMLVRVLADGLTYQLGSNLLTWTAAEFNTNFTDPAADTPLSLLNKLRIQQNGLPKTAALSSIVDLFTGALQSYVDQAAVYAAAAAQSGNIYSSSAAGVDTDLTAAITAAGATGTNGTFALPIAAPGAGGTQAVGTFTVAGGIITAVNLSNAGSNYTAGQVIGNAALAALSAGLTGASITLTAGGGVAFNAYFSVPVQAGADAFIIYRNVAGTATEITRSPSSAALQWLLDHLHDSTDELLEDNTPAFSFAIVDRKTGYHLLWVDDDGVIQFPALDARLDAQDALIAAADLSALKTTPADTEIFSVGSALPGMTGRLEDFVHVEADGTIRAAKVLTGDDRERMLVETTDTKIMVRIRTGNPKDNYWLKYTWEYKTKAQGAFDGYEVWRFDSIYLEQRNGVGWSFTELFFFIGGGEQDIVSSEASSGGLSIDDGGTMAPDGKMGPGHGNEYMNREPYLYVNGKEFPVKKFKRWKGVEETLIAYSASIYRPRNPQAVHGVTTPLARVDKIWRMTQREQLRARYRITNGATNWTSEFIYMPLYTVPVQSPAPPAAATYVIVESLLRDYGFEHIAVPGGFDTETPPGAEPEDRAGVRRVVYSSDEGSIHIFADEPMRWSAAGYRKFSGRLDCDIDTHGIKATDPDRKTYYTLGGDDVGGGLYRLNAGDILEREAQIQVFKS